MSTSTTTSRNNNIFISQLEGNKTIEYTAYPCVHKYDVKKSKKTERNKMFKHFKDSCIQKTIIQCVIHMGIVNVLQ